MTRRWRPRLRGRRWRPGGGLARHWRLVSGLLVLAVGAAGGGWYFLRHRVETVNVAVDGRPVAVRHHAPRVSDALDAAHRRPWTGRLLSAVTHSVLNAKADPPRFTVNEADATPSTRLQSGDRVEVFDGVDQTEGLATHLDTGSYVGLPDVEKVLWRPGIREVDSVVVGIVSHEEVTRTQLTASAPAKAEDRKVVALTFDDGPNPQWTPQILQILQAKAVRATFCTVGYASQRYKDLLTLEVADQEAVCDHTLDHIVPLSKRVTSQIADQIWKQADLIQDVTGVDPVLFRSPGGDVAPNVIEQAHLRRLRVMQWSVDPHDYERPPAAMIVERVMSQVRPGGIVLMHDGGGDRSQTVAALPVIIDQLRAQGYGFTTVLDEPPT